MAARLPVWLTSSARLLAPRRDHVRAYRLVQAPRGGLAGQTAALTFGRVRPAHLATMIYGWLSMVDVGIRSGCGAAPQDPRPPAVGAAGELRTVEPRCARRDGRAAGGVFHGVEWIEMPVVASSGSCRRWGCGVRAALVAATSPRAAPLYLGVVPRRVHAVDADPAHRRAAPDLFGRAARNGELVVRPQHPRAVADANRAGGGLLFIPKVVGGPVYSYHLSSSASRRWHFLQLGRRPPPRRTAAALARDREHHVQRDDDHPGPRRRRRPSYDGLRADQARGLQPDAAVRRLRR